MREARERGPKASANMIRLDYLRPSEAWRPDFQTIVSFAMPHRACRIRGPARLVRLITVGGQAPEGQFFGPNDPEGAFWFAEDDFLMLKACAQADLGGQGRPDRFGERLGMYLRHQFRDVLAVRRDWTPSFDGYVLLSVPAGASVTALVGWIKEQPVYSPKFPGEASGRLAGIRLAGGLTQYVINLKFPANRPARRWIGASQPF
jgi:hypothetical protein